MSEPLSKVLGLKKDEVYGGTFADNQIQIGKNMTIDELDQRSPDAKELTTIIVNFSWKMRDEELHFKDMAQEIINKMSVWIVKESSGQCNHEFMQQYDFSKFSNAGNSLKCVKCGLIKKG